MTPGQYLSAAITSAVSARLAVSTATLSPQSTEHSPMMRQTLPDTALAEAVHPRPGCRGEGGPVASSPVGGGGAQQFEDGAARVAPETRVSGAVVAVPVADDLPLDPREEGRVVHDEPPVGEVAFAAGHHELTEPFADD